MLLADFDVDPDEIEVTHGIHTMKEVFRLGGGDLEDPHLFTPINSSMGLVQ